MTPHPLPGACGRSRGQCGGCQGRHTDPCLWVQTVEGGGGGGGGQVGGVERVGELVGSRSGSRSGLW